MVALVPVEVEELLVDRIALRVLHRLAHYALDPFRHRSIEHDVP